jgi:serine/threonine protein kinase
MTDLLSFLLQPLRGATQRGSFGKVTAVFQRDKITGKSDKSTIYAMKGQEKSRILKDKTLLESLWVERKILSMVYSPFLLYLVYAFQCPVELFLLMPLLEGGDLLWHLGNAHQQWPEDTVRFYIAEMLLGLKELHQHNIVFRDLKPANILLGAQGHARLSDFGLSVILTAEDDYQVREPGRTWRQK